MSGLLVAVAVAVAVVMIGGESSAAAPFCDEGGDESSASLGLLLQLLE